MCADCDRTILQPERQRRKKNVYMFPVLLLGSSLTSQDSTHMYSITDSTLLMYTEGVNKVHIWFRRAQKAWYHPSERRQAQTIYCVLLNQTIWWLPRSNLLQPHINCSAPHEQKTVKKARGQRRKATECNIMFSVFCRAQVKYARSNWKHVCRLR